MSTDYLPLQYDQVKAGLESTFLPALKNYRNLFTFIVCFAVTLQFFDLIMAVTGSSNYGLSMTTVDSRLKRSNEFTILLKLVADNSSKAADCNSSHVFNWLLESMTPTLTDFHKWIWIPFTSLSTKGTSFFAGVAGALIKFIALILETTWLERVRNVQLRSYPMPLCNTARFFFQFHGCQVV